MHIGPLQSSIQGHRNDMLQRLALAGKSKTNAARNLHRILASSGAMLPIKPDCIRITVKLKKKKNKRENIWFPILRMTSWIECLVKECPQLLLAGHGLEDHVAWGHVFYNFWALYREVDPQHPIFESGINWAHALPYMIHGDEGRGLRNVPWMVEAWQLLISHQGIMETNESSFLNLIGPYTSFSTRVH